MRKALCILLLTSAMPLLAQQRGTQTVSRNATPGTGPADVVLDIPHVSVDNVSLDVERLDVHLALDANVANLVRITAGADAGIDNVKLEIVGVEAEVYLVVRLDRVADVIERTLDTIDENPAILTRLLDTADHAVGTVGGVAENALQPGGVVSQAVGAAGRTLDNVTAPQGVLSQTVNTLGHTVQRTLDSAGNILERTVDDSGKVVSERTVERLLDMEVVRETKNARGEIVRQVRDASGALLEFTLDSSGRITESRVVSRGATTP